MGHRQDLAVLQKLDADDLVAREEDLTFHYTVHEVQEVVAAVVEKHADEGKGYDVLPELLHHFVNRSHLVEILEAV